MAQQTGLNVGANIKTKRRSLGLNQEELALKLGLTQANISRIEASSKGPSAGMLLSIANALGCDVRELLGVEEDGSQVQDLDEDAKAFILNTMRGDPQFGMHLRSFVKESGGMSENDWKFMAASLKLSLGYALDTIKARHLKGNF